PAGNKIADAVGLSLALGPAVVAVRLMKTGALEQTLAYLPSFFAGHLGAVQHDRRHRIITAMALTPFDQLSQHEARKPALRRKYPHALQRPESHPLVAVIDQHFHEIGIGRDGFVFNSDLQTNQLQLRHALAGHRYLHQTLAMQHQPALEHRLELNPIELRGPRMSEGI